jgi:hypothetical protein
MTPAAAQLLRQQASWQQDRRHETWADKLRKSARARAALPANWPPQPPNKD